MHTQIRIALVVSQFNDEITHELLQGALAHLASQGISQKQCTVAHVPGAIEIPLIAKLFAKQQQYDAIICLGAVIRGETSHYDYVCQQVSQGCQQVMLTFDIPVIFGILTTENTQQAQERIGGKEGHKGKEAAATALAMINLIKRLS